MERNSRSAVVFAAIVAFAALVWLARSSLSLLVSDWFARPEYSHGILIPFLTAYLLYSRRTTLAVGGAGVGFGVALVVVGVSIVALGILSTIQALAQYGFAIACIGLFYSVFGVTSWRQTALPLVLLLFMVPLPHMIHQAISTQAQLWSSQLGVAGIRAMNITVSLEGNVIDLGTYQLQVLEACDGLRYLFPLCTLSFIFAYLFKGPLWQRFALFASAIPTAILINSLRIAIIGYTVEHYGIGMAEGFLHEFQGWTIFFVGVAGLLAVAKLLMKVSGDTRALSAKLSLAFAGSARTGGRPRAAMASMFVSAAIVVGVSFLLADSASAKPPTPRARQEFVDFPLQFDGWNGRRDTLEARYLDELKVDDYLLADYRDRRGAKANLYVAYYDNQLGGRSVHSP